MIQLDCPACAAPLACELGFEELACDACLVRVDVAPDPQPREVPVAA